MFGYCVISTGVCTSGGANSDATLARHLLFDDNVRGGSLAVVQSSAIGKMEQQVTKAINVHVLGENDTKTMYL